MSIAILNQVFEEVRRLTIAGSGLAADDFRLKKLIPPLKKAGAKAPVFAKVAESLERLQKGRAKELPRALLEVSTLVTAILYTQGQTGVAGELEPIETTELDVTASRASARVLKPLIEALTSTGSGRLELIRDAHTRGAFQDLRLVNHAVAAIDDPYPDIGEFVSRNVLPLYGKAIYSGLRAKYDPKGKGGQVRRLRLMHALDPEATRDLVLTSLEEGSKEVKVAALRCLGDSAEDTAILMEQVKARAKDVRAAAIASLGGNESAEVVEVLIGALGGKDVGLAAGPVAENKSKKLLGYLLDSAEEQLETVLTTKDKKKLAKPLAHFHQFLPALAGRKDKRTLAFLTRCFEERETLTKRKGSPGGSDIIAQVVALMVLCGSKQAQEQVVGEAKTLAPELVDFAFVAAVLTKTPAEVYKGFSPFLTKVDPKKTKGPEARRREVLRNVIFETWAGEEYYYNYDEEDLGGRALTAIRGAKLDNKWLDAAVKAKDLELVGTLARPKHAATQKFLSAQLKEAVKKKDGGWQASSILTVMIRIGQKETVDAFMETLKAYIPKKKRRYYSLWPLVRLIPDLPKAAAPRLEKLIPELPDEVADQVASHLAELQSK